MTQHTVRYVAEELEELVGMESTEKAHKTKDKLGAHEGLGSWEIVDGWAETVKTPTSGSQQQASVKCKIDMRWCEMCKWPHN